MNSNTTATAGDGLAERKGTLRKGAIEARHLVFFVVAAAAPLTVLAGFAPLAFLVGGDIAPAGYLLAGVVYGLFAVGFTAMSRYVRNAGAFYAYITQGLGRSAGAGSALVAYVAYTLGEIGFCAAAGLFASTTLRSLAGVAVPWSVCALLLGVVVCVVAYRRVEAGARLLAILLLAEIGILLVLAFAILWAGVPEGYSAAAFSPANWSWSLLGPLFVMTFVVYIGFEQTAVYSEEVADPSKTVPRATYVAVAVLTFLYTFMSWIFLMAIGPSNLTAALGADPSMLVFGINTTFAGAFMTDVMQVLIVTSFVAGVLALHNAGSRYLFSLGREGLLPAKLATTGAETASPTTAVIVQSAILLVSLLAFGLSGLDPYTQIVVWTNTPTLVGVLFLQILTSIAVILYFARNSNHESPWHRLVAPGLAAIALIVVLWLVCTKMDLLTALGNVGNLLINLPLILAFVLGVFRASQLRRNNPNAWIALGQGQA
ncbi:amino acid/polyamine/organocation transporter (APC superfamily) [Rhizobium subbaraonis]|uniref:Amino acid/polyamine/organocation transporter (APC superfamily) n=1 Tax=Rhizobium subbaraonis TaxID=908946 RepID=A0A285UYZ0_9HYPH|nr:APC family permease [Rhizobium subbaraonis]SOC46568.1 amino acid/polyamine/organocation transporter (APC superfamily) [Rhizobium subbaraonis]